MKVLVSLILLLISSTALAATSEKFGMGGWYSKFQPEIELSAVDAHRSLSRRHALIKRSGDGYEVVEDSRARNGTFLNGRRLSPGVAVPLKEGDEVSFGLITTVFRTT